MKQRKKEHPILMCSEMVRAILAGTKTETRRMAGLKELNKEPNEKEYVAEANAGHIISRYYGEEMILKSPYGVAGDTLWVRETYKSLAYGRVYGSEFHYKADGYDPELDWDMREKNRIIFADTPDHDVRYRPLSFGKWKPSIHMPRWASRITLTVKGVTLERLHEITDEGAKAEGVADRAEYESLWKHLNSEESWSLNPWVWVVKFDVKEIKK